jgi:hypothetical protein
MCLSAARCKGYEKATGKCISGTFPLQKIYDWKYWVPAVLPLFSTEDVCTNAR